MHRIIGYARVSTRDQNMKLQIDALTAAGAETIFQDTASGASTARPQLAAAIDSLEPGDVLTVWKLDRLGRSLRQVIHTAGDIEERGAHFRSLTEQIDTTSPAGRVVFHVMAALAEFERDLIKERVAAGMTAARKAGKHMGRPSVFSKEKSEVARKMLDEGRTWSQITRVLGVSQATLSRGLRKYEAKSF